jgi:hypothetical protein
VLAECAAKRRIVEMHEAAVNHDEMCGWPCETLLALAAVYADNPEFLESWRGDDADCREMLEKYPK